MSQPTVISTFAGCGGSSLGYHLAGFKELLAIDFDKHAEQTFKANFPEVPFWNRNIREVDAQEILDFTGLKAGELDVFDGSPPCQGFSTAGKRRMNDDRSQLYKDYVRLVQGLKPKAFVMENVRGLTTGKMKGMLIDMVKELRDSGYQVNARLMDAAHYNTPQTRVRVIFLGVRNDLARPPSYPNPSTKTITLREALEGVDNTGAEVVTYQGKHAHLKGLIRHGKRMADILPNGHGYGLRRLKWNRPSYTVTKTVDRNRYAGLLHPDEDRYLTIPEVKRVCGFPDDFIITGKFEEQWARFGNAVMPPMMKAIASSLRANVLEVA